MPASIRRSSSRRRALLWVVLAFLLISGSLIRLQSALGAPVRPLPGSAIGSVTASGTIIGSGQTVVIPVGDQGTTYIQIEGTWTATLVFEATISGSTWGGVSAVNIGSSTIVSSATANGIYMVPGGFSSVRVRCSAYTSGTATITMRGSPAGPASVSTSTAGAGAATIADGADVAQGATTDVAVQGDNAGTLSAKLRGLNKSIAAGIPVSSLPALAAGANAIGTVGVTSLPALPAGANAIGTVGVTQLPTAAAIADATANPTVTSLASYPMLFNGTTWDRWRDSAGATNTTTGVAAAGLMVFDTVDVQYKRANSAASAIAGGLTGKNVLATAGMGYGGSNAFYLLSAPVVGQAVASTGNPLQIGGSDGTNARSFLLDTSGRLQIASINGALPAGSATIGAVNQGTQNGAGTASWNVQGAGATGAAVVGNPVRIGISDLTNAQDVMTANAASANAGAGVLGAGTLVYDSANSLWRRANCAPASQGTATSGTLTPLVALGAMDTAGNILPVGTPRLTVDGTSGPNTLSVHAHDFNGATYDRHRNNVDATLLASAARTTTQTSADIVTYNAHSIIVTVDITSTTSTVSLTPAINYKDPASGKYIALLTGTTLTATGTTTYAVNPNFSSATGTTYPYTKVAQADLGRVIQITITAGNANSQTYSVGYTLCN